MMNARRHPFTVIEMLMVVVVIAILAGIIIGGAQFAFDKSQESAIKMELKTLEMALEEYKKDWGYYPIWTDKKELVGSGSTSTAEYHLGTNPIPAAEFYIDTTYSTNFKDPLFGIIKGDGMPDYKESGWVINFDLKSPDGRPYLGDTNTTPLTQLDGPRGVRYRYPGVKNPEKYDLLFPGHDEKFGTTDDITNWTQR
ncbi:MAG: hypothetical protein RRC34_08400 [Lentisphaeria bacterium]|nr:hypothetical protein [Lentisphaeria bacterium]